MRTQPASHQKNLRRVPVPGSWGDTFRSRRTIIALIGLSVLISLIAVSTTMGSLSSPNTPPSLEPPLFAPPRPEALPSGAMPLTPEQAAEVNAQTPTAGGPREAALPFVAVDPLGGALGRRSAVDCLTAAVYYEAASESTIGQRAVAQVVLNRVRHPAYPNSICEVVYQGSERSTGCQFTFTCDGSLQRRPSRAGWDRARLVASNALAGSVEPSVGMATHYHTVWIVPYWAASLDKVGTVGAHIFYRWKGTWGKRRAFVSKYLGEPQDTAVSIEPLVVGLDDTQTTDSGAVLGPRPLADEQMNLPANEALSNDAPRAVLEADLKKGTLTADEKAGKLPSANKADAAPPEN